MRNLNVVLNNLLFAETFGSNGEALAHLSKDSGWIEQEQVQGLSRYRHKTREIDVTIYVTPKDCVALVYTERVIAPATSFKLSSRSPIAVALERYSK